MRPPFYRRKTALLVPTKLEVLVVFCPLEMSAARRLRRRACRQAGRDDQNSDRETGGAKENHAAPPKAPSDEKPQPDGTAKPDGSATKHGTPQPAANAREAQEPEPAPQKQEEEEEEGETPTGHADDGNEKRGAPAPASARTNATERAAKVPRETPRGPANDATENTRNRDDGRAARTAASTPGAQPTNTDDDGASAAKHADREAGATEREPENPTTGAPDRAATTEEGKSEEEGATTGSPPQTPGARGGAGKQIRLRMICFSASTRPGCSNRSRQRSRRRQPIIWKRKQRAESGDGACAGKQSQGPRRNDKTIFSASAWASQPLLAEKIVLAEREARPLTLF